MLVGPGRTYAKPSLAAAAAQSGDVIVISAGDYIGDVATWTQSDLTICGSGGRARLFADGQNAAGKGIWVIQGNNVTVENVEFHDAKVPDQNGAGIRAEGLGLTIRNCGFYDNEDGILSNDGGVITIDRSEFARNGFGDGQSHNIYIGRVDRLVVTSSFFHEARIGHNLKSRARETRIENSYFMDGPNGTSSYLINVPNGGVVYLRGNLLHKGPRADNSIAISYGEEGLPFAANSLEMVHNTLVMTWSGGSFIDAASAIQSIKLSANLFAGTNSPLLFNSGVASKVTQLSNLVDSASSFSGADNVGTPNFWPNPALVAKLPLAAPVDPTYTNDAHRPYLLRALGSMPRSIGALQSAP